MYYLINALLRWQPQSPPVGLRKLPRDSPGPPFDLNIVMSELLSRPGLCGKPCKIDEYVTKSRETGVFDQLEGDEVMSSNYMAANRWAYQLTMEVLDEVGRQATLEPCSPNSPMESCPVLGRALIKLELTES